MTDVEDEGKGKGKGRIAEQLDKLFTTMTPEGRPYTLREAADGINAKAGRNVVTFQYLSLLRAGAKKRPSYEKLQAIANWFGVDVRYFSDDEVAQRTDEEIRILQVMRDNKVRSLAFRAAALGPEDLEFVLGMVNRLQPADGSPDPAATASQAVPADDPAAPDGPES